MVQQTSNILSNNLQHKAEPVLNSKVTGPKSNTKKTVQARPNKKKLGADSGNKWSHLSRTLFKQGQKAIIASNLFTDGIHHSIDNLVSNRSDLSYHIGIINVVCTNNNTFINLTDNYGNVIFSRSPRQVGFKGSKRSTSYAATVAAELVFQVAVQCGFNSVVIQVKGFGPGRNAAFYVFSKHGLPISRTVDVTALPHNGCRPPKKRRI